ncbi:MAG: FtsX-like permease family protein [Actinomycetota bacterium]
MRSIRLAGLGVRMALSGGRASLTRMALMALSLAIGVALLLGALSVGPATGARRARDVARGGQVAQPSAPIQDVTFRWGGASTRFEGVAIPLFLLRGVGNAPVPPGIPALPRPGEAYVSPALAALLDGPDGVLLRPRIPGNVVGTIGDEGLLFDGELYGYVGAPASFPAARLAIPEVSFAAVEGPTSDLTFTALLILCVFVLGLLLPVGLLIVTTTRLSAATREARLAAVRLAGATQSQVRLLAAAESALASVVASVVAWPLFLLGRIVVSKFTIFGYRWFPGDFAPPPVGILALLLGLPLFTVLVTTLGMRRLIVSPLGVARRTRRHRLVPLWPALLVIGLLGLAGSSAFSDAALRLPTPLPGVLLAGSLTLLLAGLAGTVPALGRFGAKALARWGPTPSVLLGARRLESEPTSASRVVAGVTVLLALVGMAQALALSALSGTSSIEMRPWASALPAATVFVSSINGHDRSGAFEVLRTVPGVRSVSMRSRIPTGGHGRAGSRAEVLTDGDPATVERIRNELAWVADAETLDELRASYGGSKEALRTSRMMNFVTVLVLLVTAASLLVSTVDGMMERRRPMAVLSAIGVPLSVMRRSVFVQIAIPLAAALVLGVASSLVVVALLFRANGETVVYPFGPLALTAAAVSVMVVLVTAIALPWASVARRPELLRNA